MAEHGIYQAFTRTTRRLFGHSVNPHLMRDAAMTAMAEQAPEHVRAGARLLGHASLTTGERHYNHADMITALGLYHLEIAKLIEGDNHEDEHDGNEGDEM